MDDEKYMSCLLTTSYDGRLRIWRDLDQSPMIALERKLDSQAWGLTFQRVSL